MAVMGLLCHLKDPMRKFLLELTFNPHFDGGIFIMIGGVLPCFDASTMILPEDTSCIITVPISLGIASNLGVVAASKTEMSNGTTYSVSQTEYLLQKPTVEELVKHKAILDDGRKEQKRDEFL